MKSILDEAQPCIVSQIDVEDLIFQCVPGGTSCDPQTVADNIREYCVTKTSAMEWLEKEAPQIIHDAWTCSVDMSGNRWTVVVRINGPRQKFRGKTLLEAATKARYAFVLAHPNY